MSWNQFDKDFSAISNIHDFIINYSGTWLESGSTVSTCRPWAPGGWCVVEHRPFGSQVERSLVYRK